MKILWITNITFPEAIAKLERNNDLKASGGWLLGSANVLTQNPDIKLFVASVSTKVSKLTKIEGRKITYYLLPFGKGNTRRNSNYEPLWREINSEILPDVVHIHGTEFSHGLAFINACGEQNVAVSIQGMTSVYADYYCHGIPEKDLRRNRTFHDIIRGSSTKMAKEFAKRGEYEKETICKADHVIGRTSWDKAHCWAINPDAEYHFCNETLREEFYDGGWQYQNCVPHSIFLSQAYYPIKGLHQVLKALPLILRHYPDTQIRIAGEDVTRRGNLRERLRLTDYGKIILKIIRRLGLQNNVKFLGPLNASSMKKEYLRANVFVMPSSIENSPNSLGEAQILGVPCVASYVGGICDMIPNEKCGKIYRFDDVEMLARKVCEAFVGSPHFDNTEMQEVAHARHNKEKNSSDLLEIYRSIMEKNAKP